MLDFFVWRGGGALGLFTWSFRLVLPGLHQKELEGIEITTYIKYGNGVFDDWADSHLFTGEVSGVCFEICFAQGQLPSRTTNGTPKKLTDPWGKAASSRVPLRVL